MCVCSTCVYITGEQRRGPACDETVMSMPFVERFVQVYNSAPQIQVQGDGLQVFEPGLILFTGTAQQPLVSVADAAHTEAMQVWLRCRCRGRGRGKGRGRGRGGGIGRAN